MNTTLIHAVPICLQNTQILFLHLYFATNADSAGHLSPCVIFSDPQPRNTQQGRSFRRPALRPRNQPSNNM